MARGNSGAKIDPDDSLLQYWNCEATSISTAITIFAASGHGRGQPGPARMAAARGVSLQLSGHTHGGMIPGLDRLVAMGNSGFVSGRYMVDGMTLYVNNGTGIWPGFAMRLGRRAELTRITLHRKS